MATCTLQTRLMADDCYTKTVSFFFSPSFSTRSQHTSFRVVTRLDDRINNRFSIRFQQWGSGQKFQCFIYENAPSVAANTIGKRRNAFRAFKKVKSINRTINRVL